MGPRTGGKTDPAETEAAPFLNTEMGTGMVTLLGHLDWLRDAQGSAKVLFLGVSGRVLGEGVASERVARVRQSTPPMGGPHGSRAEAAVGRLPLLEWKAT